MAKSDKKKPSINPGLVRSDSDYKHSKQASVSNPTKQLATTALPVAERENTFAEMYAISLRFNWLPMSSDNIVIPAVIPEMQEVSSNDVKPSGVVESIQRTSTKFDNIKKEKHVMDAEPDLIDLTGLVSDIAEKAQKERVEYFEPVNVVEEQVENRQENVFEAINAVPVSEEKPTQESVNIFDDVKPSIIIDRVEIRISTNSEGETRYMVGKKIMDEKGYSEYRQGIYGKILAMDCKKLLIRDSEYTATADGNYRDSSGNLLNPDELIANINNIK